MLAGGSDDLVTTFAGMSLGSEAHGGSLFRCMSNDHGFCLPALSVRLPSQRPYCRGVGTNLTGSRMCVRVFGSTALVAAARAAFVARGLVLLAPALHSVHV